MMDIVERFKMDIDWYPPTEDTISWASFYGKTYAVDYTKATAETLKKVAWQSMGIRSTVDAEMWAERAARLQKFLRGDTALGGDVELESKAIQYDFVACFLNPYVKANHNNDLWESIDQSAVAILNEQIEPPEAGGQTVEEEAPDLTAPGSNWLLPEIPYVLYEAFRRVNLTYYAPTEDTLTWAGFQDVMFDLTGITRVQLVYRHAYLLTNVSSTVDSGIWSTMATAATGFLNANLGQIPRTTTAQVQLAIDFCKVLEFDYPHAAHNEALFKTYWEAFTIARDRLEKAL